MGRGAPVSAGGATPMVTAPRLINAIVLTGHQDDPPTTNSAPQRRWGAVEPRYPPALSTTSGTPMPKLGPILTPNPFHLDVFWHSDPKHRLTQLNI